MTTKTVGQVARASGISVRTLHHYDELGLLPPSQRADNGYRLYDDDDLLRLQEILLWRSVGMPLEEIRELLDDPGRDPLDALRLQRQHLVEQLGELHGRIRALDDLIAKRQSGASLGEVDLVALFDGFDPASFEEEVTQRWGHHAATEESRRRTRRYGAEDWASMKAEMQEVTQRFATLLRAGALPTDDQAVATARAHRLHIRRWFYDCTPQIHKGLAHLYTSDPRFRAHYDDVAPGLADFVAGAILALHAQRSKRL